MDALFAAPIGALLIFVLRIFDVSLSIMRTILAVRGRRELAALIGFFEVLIWVTAVGHALQHLDSWMHLTGYASGYAAGNYVGVWLEGRFAIGLNVVHAICRGGALAGVGARAAAALRQDGYAVTETEGRGRESTVEILTLVVPRRRVPQVLRVLRSHDPEVFVSVEEVRTVEGGFMPPSGRRTRTAFQPRRSLQRFAMPRRIRPA